MDSQGFHMATPSSVSMTSAQHSKAAAFECHQALEALLESKNEGQVGNGVGRYKEHSRSLLRRRHVAKSTTPEMTKRKAFSAKTTGAASLTTLFDQPPPRTPPPRTPRPPPALVRAAKSESISDRSNSSNSNSIISSEQDLATYALLSTAAVVGLLKLTSWAHVGAHMRLQRLLLTPLEGYGDNEYNNSDNNNGVAHLHLEQHVQCLELVGRWAPELVSDGYLVYLLQQGRCERLSRVVEAAARICCLRRSPILVAPLLAQLSQSATSRAPVVAALQVRNIMECGVCETMTALDL